jgi:hypothetical protein
MTTAREVAPNKALSGAEIKELLRQDFERLLDNHGMLTDYMAFGRIGYTIAIKLHLDNFLQRDSSIDMKSRPVAGNLAATRSGLAAVEAPPLEDPSRKAVASGQVLHRDITSPNVERVRAGMPVPVEVNQADGTRTIETVKYPPDTTLGDGEMSITDSTDETRAEWGLPPRKVAAPVEPAPEPPDPAA